MDTLEVVVRAGPELHEFIVAELADLGFEAFQSAGSELKAYVPADQDSPRLRSSTREAVISSGGPRLIHFNVLPGRNWNEEWERSATPVQVGRFAIVRSGHRLDALSGEPLWIEPKMSFGTGHHESTRLALGLLETTVRAGDIVLDAGTGTGILAIAAARLGAAQVLAFDIDEWSGVNCPENIRMNGVSDSVRFILGDITAIRGSGFDVIVANINRNALIEMLPRLSDRLAESGRLILSGLLGGDRGVMTDHALSCDLTLAAEAAEGDWWAGLFTLAGG